MWLKIGIYYLASSTEKIKILHKFQQIMKKCFLWALLVSPKLAVCKKLKLCFVVTEEYADRYAETSTAATTKSSTLGEFVENI